jgi:polyisoprenoid-binding protein YceI
MSDNDQVARARVEGTDLHIEAMTPGQAVVTVTTDSNGKLATASFTVTVTRASIPGDVNMDGKLTIADVTDLIDILLGSVLNNYDPGAADVDQDGHVSIADATTLIDRLLSR